ncbi:MAG TPA: acyl-CoA dehydratase activase [bacterium]|nr:acyl-CoA dehydratase activase [bacterium]
MTETRDKFYAGIDIGSLSTETLLIDADRNVVASNIIPTGASSIKASQQSFSMALEQAGLAAEQIAFCVSTGYGRNKVSFAQAKVTEITCHARGAHVLHPDTQTVIDIGGQDSKAIRIDSHGAVINFLMNDKCAAGTGRFLEVMARALEVDLDELGPLALKSDKDLKVSSVCTVFAESEVVSLIGDGLATEHIAWGVCRSVADRTVSLAERVGVQAPILMTGGVARNVGVVRALEDRLGQTLVIPAEPQLVGALGAAHIACDRGGKLAETA